jgi:outer membrane protein OmpA-like peptidoglycan-associated protein
MKPTYKEGFIRMKTIMHGVAALLIAGFSLGYALDGDPSNDLGTQTKNAIGISTEAAQENPALLGVDRIPTCGLMIWPITNYAAGMWSDKLALSPFTHYPSNDTTQLASYLSKVIGNSFNINASDSPSTVSSKLLNGFKNGVTIYSGEKATLLSFALNRFAFDITEHADAQVFLPAGALDAMMGLGLQRGQSLDLSNMRTDALWTTDFTFSVGLPVTVPALNDFFGLRYGAGGLDFKYIMGHEMFHAETSPGSSLRYDTAGGQEKYVGNGTLTVQTAGTGLSGPWRYSDPLSYSILPPSSVHNIGVDLGDIPLSVLPPITGHGIGLDIGGILYDETGTLTINVRDLGVIFWLNQVQTSTYNLNNAGLDGYGLSQVVNKFVNHTAKGLDSLFRANGGSADTSNVLVNGNGFAYMLPLKLDIGYNRAWDLAKTDTRYLAQYANVSANYEQGFTQDPGSSYIPRLSIGGEAGALYGYVPVRMGFVLGGPELIASALGIGFNCKYFQMNAAYKAVGTFYFVPKNGFEAAAGLGFNWGMTLPPKYTVVPEYDRDHDGIPDSVDKCPDVPEDKDGFQDEDGCPDYDNDNDGIPDSVDQCPNLSGTKENDGCPVFDQDKDGIPDSLDKCPQAPENYNGYMDEDGCPDTIAPKKIDTVKPTAKEMEVLNTKLRDINFKTGSAELLSASFSALDYVVGFLKQYPLLRYEVQGHTDSRGGDDLNLLLSAARAASVRTYLIAKGIPDSSLIAIGYGKTKPIATNNTAAGRALNRRVEFKFIESAQEYSTLKVEETMFQEKIKEAKLKGAKY